MEITHNNLPQAVTELFEELNTIKNLLLNQNNQAESDKLLTIKEASSVILLSVQTIYGLVSRNEIPFSKRPNSKRLWFSKQDLTNWIKEGRRKTVGEIKAEANTYVKMKGGSAK